MGVRALARRAALAAMLTVVSCERDRAQPLPDSAAPAVRVASATASGGTKPACPPTGHWTACQVRTRLVQAGVAPRDTDATALGDLPGLGSIPMVYEVGAAGLAVYLFPDSVARRRAARSLDSTKFVAPDHELTMRGEGTAIESDNLLALLFTRREQQRERVSDALTAGPPQP
jgi:hypothetical protein